MQARLDAQRAAVLDAAARLIAGAGLRGCSVAAVAGEAGIASGTVYNHFENKADLLSALFRRTVDHEVAAVQAAVALRVTAPERIVALIETFAGRAMKQPRLAYALLAEPVEPAVDRLRLEYHDRFRDILADVLADAVAAGELPPQSETVVATALVGAIDHALVAPLRLGTDDPETIPALIQFALRAVGARHADA